MRSGLMLVGLAVAGLLSTACTTADAPPAPPARVSAAEPAPAARTTTTADADKVVCRRMTPTGSNMPQKVCNTVAVWNKFDKQGREGVDEIDRQRQEAGSTGRGE